jgi:glycosyltransferase involved in cell wall biosynthesis
MFGVLMNLLFVIDSLGSGGAQRQIVNLARGLKNRGHYVEIFNYHPDNHYQPILVAAEIPVHLHLKTSRFSFSPLLALRRLIRQRQFDIVLSFLDTPSFYAEVASIGLEKTKLVVSERFMYPPGKLPFKLSFLQGFHRLADAISVNSHHQCVRMVSEYPWMSKKIKTIYNGYDLDSFSPTESRKGLDNKLFLLAISSVSYKKNSINLAKALVICRDTYNLDVHINWIGTKQVSGDGLRPTQQTNDYLKENGLSENWEWLGERTDIPQMLASHDALIHPSYFEGLPNVVCEALACGRPVLASRVCDHSILVQENSTGYLFNPGSPEEIAQSIFKFSQLGVSAREVMGQTARAFAVQNLSLNRYVDEYENLFKGILLNKSPHNRRSLFSRSQK